MGLVSVRLLQDRAEHGLAVFERHIEVNLAPLVFGSELGLGRTQRTGKAGQAGFCGIARLASSGDQTFVKLLDSILAERLVRRRREWPWAGNFSCRR